MSGKSVRVLATPLLTGALLLSLACASALAASAPVFTAPASLARQSTTGPLPPPGVAAPKASRAPRAGDVLITGVPCYFWHDGCGPTAVGMVVGYWDTQGYDQLIPGDTSTETAAVDQAIASHGTGGSGEHYEDYAEPIDSYPTLLLDKSSLGGAHVSDCIADFMHTSWSADGNYYGWSYNYMIGASFVDFVDHVYPAYGPTSHSYTGSSLTWALVKKQMNSGHPMVFLVDSDGDGYTDHFVTIIGYNDTTDKYACWDTWYDTVRWARFRPMSSSYKWGVYEGFTFALARPLHLTSPNGGESWQIGSKHAITWTGGHGNVHIELSRDGGYPWSTWQDIAASTTNDGSYGWTVSGPATADAMLRISTPGLTDDDYADAAFAIADETPPVTTASGGGTAWHKSAVTVTLHPADSGSGMVGGQAGTWYKVDAVPSWTAGSSVVVSGDGVHTLHYYSRDYAGNTETAKKCTVKIDSGAPVTSAGDASARKDRTATLSFEVSDLTPKATVKIVVTTPAGAPRKTFKLGKLATGKQLTYSFRCTLHEGDVPVCGQGRRPCRQRAGDGRLGTAGGEVRTRRQGGATRAGDRPGRYTAGPAAQAAAAPLKARPPRLVSHTPATTTTAATSCPAVKRSPSTTYAAPTAITGTTLVNTLALLTST